MSRDRRCRSARARIKVRVKRILKQHGYPPDLQDEATQTVLAQAGLLTALWIESQAGNPWYTTVFGT